MQVPGSVVVTQEFIDFVDIKARIKRNDFVGFTSAPGGSNRRSSVSQYPYSTHAFCWRLLLADVMRAKVWHVCCSLLAVVVGRHF
jgi:hypothetical protein